MSDSELRFDGVRRLVGSSGFNRILKAHVCVIGVGGVGSWTVEALARSGVGKLTLIDLDEVCISNTNRQLHALDGEIGKPKVSVLRERCLRINPAMEVNAQVTFFTAENADQILSTPFDWVADAIDNLSNKALLLACCRSRGIPVTTTGGAGGKFDPTQIRVADLASSNHDRLLQKLRKELRAHHGFPEAPTPFGIECVYSPEPVVYPWADGRVCATQENAGAMKLDCEGGFGAAAHLTGAFGLALASRVIRGLAESC